MSSGKDRMEFPEVPEDLDDGEWPFWINLNRVICQACAPDLNERFQTGAAFADALRAVTEVSPPTVFQKVGKVLKQAALLLFTSFLAGGAWASYKHQQEWAWTVPLPQRPPPPSMLPETGKPWQSIYANWFSFKKDRHVADQPVDLTLFNRFLEATMRPFEGEVVPLQTKDKKTLYVVIVPQEDATDFCDWMTQRERKAGRLTDAQEYGWTPFRQVNRPQGAHPRSRAGRRSCARSRRSHLASWPCSARPRPPRCMRATRCSGRRRCRCHGCAPDRSIWKCAILATSRSC